MTKFDKSYLFSSQHFYLILATANNKTFNKIYQLDRSSDELQIFTYPKTYHSYNQAMNKVGLILISEMHSQKKDKKSESFKQEMAELVQTTLLCKFYGIIGFIRFVDYHYMILITQKEEQSVIGSNTIYKITQTKKILIQNQEYWKDRKCFNYDNIENQYIELFDTLSLDNGCFFFSYDLDITQSHQNQINQNKQQYFEQFNNVQRQTQTVKTKQNNRFVWNHKLLHNLYDQTTDDELIVKVISGSVLQLNIQIESDQSHFLQYLVISRRQRLNQGPRYISRGIDINCNPANEVESEQILFKLDKQSLKIVNIQSYLITRGSIPLKWKQPIHFNPQPKIEIDQFQELDKTKSHLESQINKYGQLIIYNLIKQNKIENEIKEEFEESLNKIGLDQLKYNYMNFLEYYNDKKDPELIYKVVLDKVSKDYQTTQQFQFDFASQQITQQQKGILRINCIDCLDRTNNFIGIDVSHVLALQLINSSLQIDQKYFKKDGNGSIIQINHRLLQIFYQLYAMNGDIIAELYAGSAAFHKNEINIQDDKTVKVKQNIIYPAIKRFINNNLTDWNKYLSIQLQLGNYQHSKTQDKHIWDYHHQEDFQQMQYQIDENDDEGKTFNCQQSKQEQKYKNWDDYNKNQENNRNIFRISL